jgi:outer membrane protein TolC
MFQADPVQEALIHNYYAGVQRRFSTGTTLSAGVTGIHQNTPSMAVGPGTSVGGDFYQTGVRVELTQDLLKNSFGVSERLTEQTIANAQRMNKQLLKMKLSGLVVDAVVGYWNVVIAEELLQTSEASLKSTMEIRNLIVQKLPLGLAESEDVQDWNGKVLQSRNGNEQAKKLLFDSKLTVARVLNLEQGTEFEFITRFKTEAPDITYEQALKDAFDNRIDWNNQKLLVQNAELEYRIASNTLLPSLKLKAAAGSQDYDRAAYASTLDNINREYSVGLEFMYPLGDSGGTARMQQARLAYMKAQVDTEALELQIRDEIKIIVNHCEVSYKIYQQTKAAREYAQNYYFQVLNKFRRGRYSAIQLKMALDGYTQARYAELQSLIGYNITLLRREFSRNVIFENMGVDIDTILKQIEG